MNLLCEKVGELIAETGGVRPAARKLGVSAPHLMRLRDGEVDNPGPKILRFFNLKREVSYRLAPRSACVYT